MAKLLSRADCSKHAGELAIAKCDHCRNPLCAICKIDALGLHQIYCSHECSESAEMGSFVRFEDGLEAPFATGLKLWGRSLRVVVLKVAPVSLLIALLVRFGGGVSTEPDQPVSGIAGFAVLLLFLYGITVTATVLSQQYTGLIRGNPHIWAVRQLVPWVLTLVLILAVVTVGSIMLIIPGVILSIRLFWADEFALAHRADPIEALKESWELTRGEAATIFPFQLLASSVAFLVTTVGVEFPLLRGRLTI